MMMAHQDLETPIAFKDGVGNIIIVEREDVLSGFIVDLIEQMEDDDGPFVLSDEGEQLSLSDVSELVLSPFSVNINDRSSLTALHKVLCSVAFDENNNDAMTKLLAEIEKAVYELKANADLELDCDEPSVPSLLKSMNVRFHVSDDLVERLCDFITVKAVYGKRKLLIFVNLCTYLTEEQFQLFLNHGLNMKVNILFLERSMSYRPKNVEIRTLDADLCEF